MINYDALFSDGTEMFCSPMEADQGENVTIRFRAAYDGETRVYLFLISDEGPEQGHCLPMRRAAAAGGFVYYESEIIAGAGPLKYCFMIRSGDESCYYTRTGIAHSPDGGVPFIIYPGFHVPEWARGAVMYQIFPDRFRNGDPANDVRTGEYDYLGTPVRRIEDWDSLPESGMDVGNFYDGDLQGIIEKLDYLRELGIEVLYLNPVFVSPSNHKYDAQDYDHVDPHLGVIVEGSGGSYSEITSSEGNLAASDKLLARLISEAHRRGMRVILDGVFNHCGSFHKWMDRERMYENKVGYEPGAYISADSPYRDYFSFENESGWPFNDSYEGWWGHKTLPKLNYEGSVKLRSEIEKIARRWISPPFEADGWRLDVAADLGHSAEFNHCFWKAFRKTVKEEKRDALILAEHYGDPREWLRGDEWDTVMNYDAFMEPVSWFLTGMEKHSDAYREELDGSADAFWGVMTQNMASMPYPSLMAAMNELDNHDHSRFLTRTGHHVGRAESLGRGAASSDIDKAVLMEAVVIQMTWPGAPTVYYGDEAGLCGFTDPDSRRPYPWGREDEELIAFYKDAIAVHKAYSALRTGSLIMLYRDTHVLGYARFDAECEVFVFVNNRQEEYVLEAPVWRAGLPAGEKVTLTRVLSSGWNGHTTDEEKHEVHDGLLRLSLAPREAVVFVHRDGKKVLSSRDI